VQRRGKSNSPWSATNPRATGRDGEGPIHMQDAPLLAPVVVLDPICKFPPRIWCCRGDLGSGSHGRARGGESNVRRGEGWFGGEE